MMTEKHGSYLSSRNAADPPIDPLAETQPTRPRDSLSDYQPVRVDPAMVARRPSPRKRSRLGCGCWTVMLLVLVGLAAGFFLPLRTNVVLFGIDDRAEGGSLGRSDTMILLTFQPYRRYVGMLSVPRDLWVQVPGHGENRINTAHFFAEAEQTGSGPQAVKEVVQVNFGVSVRYYVRARFDNFKQVIDTMGGVEVDLTESMSGYPPGTHHLNGDQALAFVRDRAGADDFSRMRKAQILVRSLASTALSPRNLLRLPAVLQSVFNVVETDVPFYLWPKLGAVLVIAGADGLDARIIEREWVIPFTTSQGAQVLAPNWEAIRPVILEMFGE